MKNFNGELLQKYTQALKIKGYSLKTIDSYKNVLKNFFYFTEKRSKDITKNDFILFLKHIKETNKSLSYHEQFINSWRSYLKEIHGKYIKYGNEYRPRKQKRIPMVLSEQEILNGIKNCKNLKHKTIISLLFYSGMRRSELLNLKVKDIDSNNMIIRIKMGKGFKDRNIPLSEPVLLLLRKYYKQYHPKYFLFEGPHGKYSETSLTNVIKENLKTNPHSIRHSRGSNMVENGADISQVKDWFGHGSIKTTQIYLHTTINSLRKIYDPIEKAV